MKKKLVMLFIVFSFLFSFVPVSANEVSPEHEKIEPRYIVTCVSGKHQMQSVGIAMMYSGTSEKNPGSFLFRGTAYKCTKCEMMVFSEYAPGNTIRWLGRCKFSKGTQLVPGVGIYIGYGPYEEYWSLTEDDFIKGFDFLH